jgi:3-oxoacyl-[acyl-carrier protein] reductase
MDDDFGFAGKTLLVTGSGRNIGRAIVLEFARRGANVVINTRSNVAEANSVAREAEALGARALVVIGDAGENETVKEMHIRAQESFGGVDMYVSNAARRFHRSFFDTSDEDWFRYLNQQLTGAWYLAKAFVPGMMERGWGRIVHMNGPDGWEGGWMRIPHSAAKGGLRNLTKSLARGLGEFGITVNGVNPGFTDTIRDPETHPQTTPERQSAAANLTPIRRQNTTEEIAWACAFLCAERSGAINGTTLHVDGGLKMLD